MKHLLNNMSEEEKNAIREQHSGGMKVMTENFNKLLKSKLGDAKPLVNEQMNMEDDFEGVEEVSHMSFLLQNADKNTATNLLKKYMAKHSQTVNFVAILRSEGVDLTDINFCECPNLLMVNLRETPNNFEETQGNCAYNMRGGIWDFDMGDEKPSMKESTLSEQFFHPIEGKLDDEDRINQLLDFVRKNAWTQKNVLGNKFAKYVEDGGSIWEKNGKVLIISPTKNYLYSEMKLNGPFNLSQIPEYIK
jgi:hypothetical protein